jgi:hypothetical protein
MMTTTRREFLQQTAAALLLGGACLAEKPKRIVSVRQLNEPAAIAMWDFSWLLRHDPGHEIGSEFADWDKVLDGLVERGYNAIRFDVFPALVAAGAETFHFPRNSKRPQMWGNQFSTTINPRKALKEFIPRCVERGILLGLSTWFHGPGTEKITGLEGLVRVWDETLQFLKDNDLLHNVYYVDLLNEYPLFSGFKWLREQMDGEVRTQAEGVHEWKEKAGNYNNPAARKFYTGFADDTITRLQARWPGLDFIYSLTYNGSADWRVMAPTKIAALDVHYWFVMNPLLGNPATGYWQNIHKLAETDDAFPQVEKSLLTNWATHKPKLIEWMDQQMTEIAALGRQYNKPVGNTEGWGIINWLDHPSLSWDIIKESAEICAKLGRKHGYRFNCTSNFTHPQFPRLWADVAWHRRVTGMIRGI